MLKKFVLFLIVIIACLVCNIPLAGYSYALSTPHIIITEGVWLLDIESGSRLFLLPDTYYAQIDNMDNNFYYITFNGVAGKVEKSIVATVGYHTQATGTMQEIKIHSQYYDFKTIILKSSMDLSSEDFFLPVDESFIFLGQYPLAEMWYCIRYNDNIGYIKALRTTLPELEIPNFVAEYETDTVEPATIEKPEQPPINFKDPSILRILIIIGLSIPALLIIFLLFRPQKGKKTRYYYSE